MQDLKYYFEYFDEKIENNVFYRKHNQSIIETTSIVLSFPEIVSSSSCVMILRVLQRNSSAPFNKAEISRLRVFSFSSVNETCVSSWIFPFCAMF